MKLDDKGKPWVLGTIKWVPINKMVVLRRDVVVVVDDESKGWEHGS